MKRNRVFSLLATCALLVSMTFTWGGTSALAFAQGERTFPETGKTVKGRFLEYWDQNGGLPQQGLPISDEMQEKSDTDGKTYTVQYFERAVFELHDGNKPPNEVLLSLLGVSFYEEKYKGNAPGQTASTDNPREFSETGKTIGGPFREYWEAHGGLPQQGYPISDEFQEKDKDGKTRTVQYFQRAVFEYHEEFAGTKNEVLLSLLGVSFYERKYGGGTIPDPGDKGGMAVPGWTNVVAAGSVLIFYNAGDGSYLSANVSNDGTLKPVASGASGALESGFTHVVQVTSNMVFFYNKDTGQSQVARISLGNLEVVQTQPFAPGWTIISADAETGLAIFYKGDNGLRVIGKFGADGSYAKDLQTAGGTPGTTGWTQFVPHAGPLWFFYVQMNGNGVTLNINPNDGTVTDLKSYTTFHRHWTHIVSDGYNLVFYDQKEGLGGLGFVGEDGTFTQVNSFTGWNTDWSHVTATPGAGNGIFIYYASKTGVILTSRFNGGEMAELKVYKPGQ